VKVLIVDDEPLARRELRRLLATYSWVEIIGEARDVEEARERVEALRPTVVFLDVQMPDGTGFDLLEQLDRPPRVIFTTAYDRYAVKAFEVNALDYLLKPIEPERLALALEKIRTLAHPTSPSTGEGVPLDQLFVRDGPSCWFVPLDQVAMFTAEGNSVRLHWGEARPLLARSLFALEVKLDSRRFFRANRRQIVNLTFIESIEAGVRGRLRVKLAGGTAVEISRRQARIFRGRTTV
jgi:two-component system LytT family response regulator